MGHELVPRAGTVPPAVEVARLLATEFAFVRSDEAEGSRYARAQADWIERAPAHIFLGQHARALEAARRLKALAPGEALVIEVGDTPARTLRVVVLPGEHLRFGYASAEDERDSRELVERCARVLDSDVVAF